MTDAERRSARLRPQAAAIGLILLLLALMLAGSGYLFWKSYRDTDAMVRAKASSAAQVVSTNAQWAYETARQILRRVDDSLGADLTSEDPDAAAKLSEAVQTLPGTVRVYVVDAAGDTRLTTDPQFQPIEVRDREYFSALADGEDWHVSSLLVSRLNNTQIFTVSKRLERNGVFAGAAIVSLDTEFLGGVWRSLNLDQNSAVGLVRGDGQLVSRYPMPEGPVDLSDSVLFSQYLPAATTGTYETTSPIDGVARIAGYRLVPGTNLVATSAISTHAAFAALNGATLGLLAVALPTALALILGTYWIFRLSQADAKQREIEAQFQTFAEAMPNHVWTAAPSGLLDWFNSRIYDYGGAAPGSLDGGAWTRLLHPADLPGAGAAWAAALASGQNYEAQYRLRRHDGSYRWHLSRAVPIHDKAGKLVRWIGTNTDIDDQKQVSAALADSETRLRLAIDAGQLAVWEIDLATAQIAPSAALNRLYGFPGDASPTTEDYLARYAPGERERVDAISAAATARGEAELEVEIRHLWPDGSEKWLLIRALMQTGEPPRAIGVAIDITEAKRAETALRNSELQVRLALDAAEMGVWQAAIADGGLQQLTGDRRALELMGLGPQGTSSFKAIIASIHPEDAPALRSAAADALAPSGGGILETEFRVLARPGRPEHWVQARAQAVISTDGLRLVGTVRDISHRKDAETRQRLLSGELQHRIKNILAMVNAIASQTLQGEDIAERRHAFRGRLDALSQAHDILTATTWKSADIADVVTGALKPHLVGRRFHIEGPALPLPAKQALSLALTIHELATNATKYGALSNDTGTVSVTWVIHDHPPGGEQTFHFVWQEAGGPLVAEPGRQGFGTRLITRVLAADFHGAVHIEYLPAGLSCRLVAPASGPLEQAAKANWGQT